MHLDIAPETERLVREEISNGHFRSADELIQAGLDALHEIPGPMAGIQSATTAEEKLLAFRQWIKSHRDTPPLSDEAVSRTSMYPDC